MNPLKDKRLKSLALLLVPGVCAVYLFHDFDAQRFLSALSGLPLPAYPAFALLFALPALPQGLRLRLLLKKSCPLLKAIRAVLIGSGVNAILPARLGDVTKAAFLSLDGGIPFPATLCAVFWERLGDLLCVFCMALLVGLRLDAPGLYLSALILPAFLLGTLALAVRFRRPFRRLIALLPWPALRGQANSVLSRLTERRYRPHPGTALALSLAVWVAAAFANAVFFACFRGGAPDATAGLLITAAAAIGVMVPGTPGGIGTFEASTVAALSLLGVEKSEALAFALALHLVQVVPCVLYAVYAAARGRWSIAGARAVFLEKDVSCEQTEF
ncbi:MAG: flippase-like domain-containing protein [Desulfovibrio sp.]|jgi:uncharacterized membrane protein YbhN (UPF0104 family)|nr:flippase-like domain-containing protein [Desulfovibrio sp.]